MPDSGPYQHSHPDRPLNLIEKRKLFREALRRKRPMTQPDIDDRVRLLQAQAAEIVRRENDLKIVKALEKILAVCEGRMRREYDTSLSRTIDCLEALIWKFKGGQA
jgi:hypothetical protein